METKDLKYFYLTAECENINLASKNSGVPKGTISKAIKRLEDELGTQLFDRVGRSLRITNEGIFLKEKALSILAIEESARLSLSGNTESINIKIGYDQQLVSLPAMEIVSEISKLFSEAQIRIIHESEHLKKKVLSGEIGIGFSNKKPSSKLFKVKKIGTYEMKTIVNNKHPLLKKKNKLSIKEVLKYKFISTSFAVIDQSNTAASFDGWRDDKYKRDIQFFVSDIKQLEALVLTTDSIAYVPEYIIDKQGFGILNIHDCEFQCFQDIYSFTKKSPYFGWINQIF